MKYLLAKTGWEIHRHNFIYSQLLTSCALPKDLAQFMLDIYIYCLPTAIKNVKLSLCLINHNAMDTYPFT